MAVVISTIFLFFHLYTIVRSLYLPLSLNQTPEETTYERLSKLLVHGQTMHDLGGSYGFTRIPSHVSVRYRFALVKVKKTIRLTDPTRSLPCPLLPSAALYCSLLPFTVLYLPFTALYCSSLPITALYLPFTALCCTLLPFSALYCPLLQGAVAHKTIS